MISTSSPRRRPVTTRTSAVRPWRTTSTFSTPANVMIDAAGTVTTGCPVSVTISARANEPGRSVARSFGTSASTISVRFCSCTLGESRTTRPLSGVGARDQILLQELDAPVAVEARVVQHRAGLAHDGGLLGIDTLVGARRRQPQADARLLERGLGLVHAVLEVALIEPGDQLAALDPRTEIDRDLHDATDHLGAEDDLVVGGQRACGRHGARQ